MRKPTLLCTVCAVSLVVLLAVSCGPKPPEEPQKAPANGKQGHRPEDDKPIVVIGGSVNVYANGDYEWYPGQNEWQHPEHGRTVKEIEYCGSNDMCGTVSVAANEAWSMKVCRTSGCSGANLIDIKPETTPFGFQISQKQKFIKLQKNVLVRPGKLNKIEIYLDDNVNDNVPAKLKAKVPCNDNDCSVVLHYVCPANTDCSTRR